MDEKQDAAQVGTSEAVEVPKESEAYANWRLTGKIPEGKADAQGAAKNSESDAGDKPGQKSAPASETGKETIEPKQKTQSKAEKRLNEVLGVLKEEDLTPATLKALKAEVVDLRQKLGRTEGRAIQELTEKPLERPKRPKYQDFEGDEVAYETALEQYEDGLAGFKANEAIEKYKRDEADKATRDGLTEKLAEAKTRYGDEAQAVITKTVAEIVGDAKIPAAVKAIINESPVLVDLMYVMGETPEDLSEFIEMARTDPGAAIRKAILLERLVVEELSKNNGKKSTKTESSEQAEDKGKSAKGSKNENPPPPPEELGSSRGALPNPAEEAARAGDVSRYMREKNREQLARMRGQ
jgi:SepF-like predicted cell division protein (DUF552 family)